MIGQDTLQEYARATLAPMRARPRFYTMHDARESASREALEQLREAAYAMMERAPDEVISQDGAPYMKRWYVRPRPSKEVACTFVHAISNRQPDTPHSHPWDSASIVLEGTLIERWWPEIEAVERGLDSARNRLGAGDIAVRPAVHTHALEVPAGTAITLMETGPKYNDWAFCRPNEHRMTWASLNEAWNAGERMKQRETHLPAGRPYGGR